MTCEGASWLEQPLGIIRDQPSHGHGQGQVQASAHDLEGWLISILHRAEGQSPTPTMHDAGKTGKMTTNKYQ
jgi:hypothetical protein